MAKQQENARSKSISERTMVRKFVVRDKVGRATHSFPPQVEKVMVAAGISGLRSKKTHRITGRVSPDLVKQAKAHTGISSDTDLIEFALANVALEDRFAKTFRAVQGTVDPDLDLGF